MIFSGVHSVIFPPVFSAFVSLIFTCKTKLINVFLQYTKQFNNKKKTNLNLILAYR